MWWDAGMTRGATSTRIGAVLLVVVMVALPGVVAETLGLAGSATVWSLGAITALLAVLAAGWRPTAIVAVAMSVATAVAGVSYDRPWLALLVMGVSAAATGLTSRRGLSSALVMAPITVGFMLAEPPDFPIADDRLGNALVMGGVMLLATAWGLVIGALLGRRIHLPHPAGVSKPAAIFYSVLLAMLVGVAAWFVADQQLGHGGAWLMMTILIVVQPYLKDTWSRTWQRAAGTVAGFVVAFAIATIVASTWIFVVLGLGFIVAAIAARMRPGTPYWIYVTLLTPAIVMLEGSGGSVTDTDVLRLRYTLLGTAISLGAMAVLVPLLRTVARRRRSGHVSTT